MKRQRNRMVRAVGLVVAAVLACVAGLSAVPQADAATPEKTLRVAQVTEIDTFNPFLTIQASAINILRYQYEPLVMYGTNNEETGGLASEWETSPDGKTWTYTMPPDRKWSDGEPITAEDAAWTFQQVKENDKLQAANGGLVTNVASVTAVDPTTLQIVLNQAQASNPGQELPIVPKHVWENQDPTTYANDTDTVGSGPYVISRYVKGQSVELVANQNFWRGAPKLEAISYVVFRNGDAAVQALRNGEIDLVNGLTPAQFQSLENQPNIEVNSGANRRYTAMAINPGAIDAEGKPMGDGNPALKDLNVRKAIFMAVDTQTLLDRVLQGLGKIGQTEVPTTYPDYYGFAPGYEKWPFDPQQANELLDQAGWAKGSDGIRTKGGERLSLRLMGRNSDPTHAQMAEYVVGWLRDVGIEAKPMMVAPTQVGDDSTLGNYDIYFTGWGLGPDPDYQLSINTCASRPNADGSGATSENNWCSPEFDALYNAQHTELDATKRAEIVKEAFSVLYAAAVSMPIWYADTLEAYRSDRFTGFTKQPEEGGMIMGQNAYWGLYGATPVAATEGGAAAASPAANPVPWIVGGVVVVALAAAGVFIAKRRRGGADDRE